MFDPSGKLKQAEYNGQQYCTCISPDDTYPHGSPEFNCELTTAMETCRSTKTTRGVYTMSCTTRSIRSAGIARTATPNYEEEDDEPPSYPMITENTTSVIVSIISIITVSMISCLNGSNHRKCCLCKYVYNTIQDTSLMWITENMCNLTPC